MDNKMFVAKADGVNVGRRIRKLISRLSRCFACAPIVLIAIDVYAIDLQLHYPKGDACGLVMACNPPVQINGFTRRGEHARVIAHAVGDITIPDAEWLLLELHADRESQRSAIRSLPKSGIRALRIDRGTIDHATLASVCGMSSLEVLELRGCRLTDNAFSDQPGLPTLKEFVSYAEISDSARRRMARWMRDCTQLEYFYCQPELSLSEWNLLVDHPTLNFVNVSIGQDAIEVLRKLKSLRKLKGLNLKIKSDAKPGFAELLSGFDGVEWINWSGGRFGDREAKNLAKLRSLKSLVLQGDIVLTADLLNGLPQLDQLQRLVINTSKTLYDPAKLLHALNRMPALKTWPRLENLDAAGLAQLVRRKNIVSLELTHIDDGVDRQEVKSFLAGLSLEQLSLHDKLEGLDFLTRQNVLEQLRLRIPVRGDQLSALASLPKLKELHLNVDGADDLLYSPLAKCSALESVYIEGEMSAADDIGSLSQSSSIRDLFIESGYVGDAAADWLCRADAIVDVSLGRDSMLTDIGVKKLSTKQNLESLDVGGLISLEGATSLSSLRRLRRLSLHSPLLTEADQESLKSRLSYVPSISFPPFSPLRGPLEKGKDGFLRVANQQARELCAKIEGQPAPELSGNIASNAVKSITLKQLRGKVVIVDFWGVWCGPCLSMMPYLAHLEKEYGGNGLSIIGVHSQTGAEGISEYLNSHPKAWPNIVDTKGTFAKDYGVSHWPSLYIIDKQGHVRVALPHVLGLEAAVTRLLSE